MSEASEILHVVERLQGVLEDLVTRGLGSAGSAENNTLATLGEELGRVGAAHLADRVISLREGMDGRDGPERLLKTLASLRLFERVLTLEVARGQLAFWKSQIDQPAGDGTEADDESESD